MRRKNRPTPNFFPTLWSEIWWKFIIFTITPNPYSLIYICRLQNVSKGNMEKISIHAISIHILLLKSPTVYKWSLKNRYFNLQQNAILFHQILDHNLGKKCGREMLFYESLKYIQNFGFGPTKNVVKFQIFPVTNNKFGFFNSIWLYSGSFLFKFKTV